MEGREKEEGKREEGDKKVKGKDKGRNEGREEGAAKDGKE